MRVINNTEWRCAAMNNRTSQRAAQSGTLRNQLCCAVRYAAQSGTLRVDEGYVDNPTTYSSYMLYSVNDNFDCVAK